MSTSIQLVNCGYVCYSSAGTSLVVVSRSGKKVRIMNASSVYAKLQDACRALDAAEDHAIAAYVGVAMTLIEDKYGVIADQCDAAVEANHTHWSAA